MKQIISGNKLKTYIEEAINLLCGTVKTTLGPKGTNIIIDHSDFSPFITNDGVTIASNIESDNRIINTILELAKEASIKTNETVGDGTTTTLVLLESIYQKGAQIIEEGYNPIILKQELENTTNNILNIIKNKSKKPTLKSLKRVTSIAANNEEIGNILIKAYQKVGVNNIFIKESASEKTISSYLEGYIFETILASPYFLKEDIIEFSNTSILITPNTINYLEEISNLINEVYEQEKPLIIIAKDYDNSFINEIINMYLENNLKIILLKSPGYGDEELKILSDIALISNTKIYYHFENLTFKDLGKITNITINKENTKITFTPNSNITNKIKLLEKDPSDNNLKRIGMLNKGIINIYVGAWTTTERREKKMRFDDALCALKSAQKGILPGSGLILHEISNNFQIKTKGDEVLKEALTKPLTQILINAGLNSQNIIENIIKNNYQSLYNVMTNTYESINNTSITDTKEIIINSLKNAVSIASMLLTTTSLVINEYEPNLKKEDYSEI